MSVLVEIKNAPPQNRKHNFLAPLNMLFLWWISDWHTNIECEIYTEYDVLQNANSFGF